MEVEEKLDLILTKLGEKKPKDFWERTQIVATIIMACLTLLLAIANLRATQIIAELSRKQADIFHQDQELEQKREASRKERDEFIQELGLLPIWVKMLQDNNQNTRNAAYGVLQKLNKNPMFSGHPILSLTDYPRDEKAPLQGAVLFHIQKVGKESKEREGSPFWVYLGQKENGHWVSRFFEIEEMPSIGSTIKSTANVYRHNREPKKIGEPDLWDLGDKIGTMRQGSTVNVLKTLVLDGDNYWARVK